MVSIVPNSVKKVFDSFPLKEYPPIVNTTSQSIEQLETKKYFFGGDSAGNFSLGVFNVFQYKDDTFLPTDPISLSQAMILCHKNNLTLPKQQGKGSGHCIVKLSYSASPDNRLPILIEDDNHIRLCDELLSTIGAKLSGSDKLLNRLIDDLILDTWLMCIWFESDIINLSKIFALPMMSITKYDLFHNLQSWNHFGIRYPTLHVSQYENKIRDFNRTLKLIQQSEINEIIMIKINAFIIHIQYLLIGTKLYESVEHVNI